jgi:uncharacterized membrane protein YGL010W
VSTTQRTEGLLQWQWSLYPDNHRTRRNLLIHALSNPLFLSGNILLVLSVVTRWTNALAGLAAMIVAMMLQGRGHRLETVAPQPFLGPMDVIARILLEQWVTFPRFALSGKWLAAWRASKPAVADERAAS